MFQILIMFLENRQVSSFKLYHPLIANRDFYRPLKLSNNLSTPLQEVRRSLHRWCPLLIKLSFPFLPELIPRMDFSANNTKPPETRDTPKAALRFQRRASANCNFLDLLAARFIQERERGGLLALHLLGNSWLALALSSSRGDYLQCQPPPREQRSLFRWWGGGRRLHKRGGAAENTNALFPNAILSPPLRFLLWFLSV